MPTGERLGPMDATLLYLETPTSTSDIGIVCRFDGPIPFDAFLRDFEALRLPRLPRFRQVLAPVPLNLGFPTWEDDPDFDLSQHLHSIELEAPGDERQLRCVIDNAMARRIDLSRPPWDITVINNLDDGGAAILLHMHHCVTDGAGITKVFDALFDSTPSSLSGDVTPPMRTQAPPLPGPYARLAGVFRDRRARRSAARRRAAEAPSNSVHGVAARKAEDKQRLKDFGKTMKEFMEAPGIRFPFNAPLCGRVHYGYVSFDLQAVRRIADGASGTINDALLSVLGGAFNRWASEQGIELEGRFLRVYQAANARRADERDTWGNRLAFMPALVPLGVHDSHKRLQQVAAYTSMTKALGVREVADKMVRGFQSKLPPPIAKLGLRLMLARTVQQLGALTKRPPGFNIYLTNVRLPAFDWYLGERRLTELTGLAPLVPNTGVTCAVITYGGRLFMGVSADCESMPDVDSFCAHLRHAFDDGVAAAPRDIPRTIG